MHVRIAMMIAWANLVFPGCECQYERPQTPPVPSFEERLLYGEPVVHDGEALTPTERQQAAELVALAHEYYPALQPERETEDDYHERYDSDPRTRRWQEVIRETVEGNEDHWRACLREIHQAIGHGGTWARDGNPPQSYSQSFHVVVHGSNKRGQFTMVFRISMLAPVYEYYEHTRNLRMRRREMSMVPTPENAAIAERIRGIIGTYFPDHRELPPAIGALRLPDMAIGNRQFGETCLAHALFEDSRRW